MEQLCSTSDYFGCFRKTNWSASSGISRRYRRLLLFGKAVLRCFSWFRPRPFEFTDLLRINLCCHSYCWSVIRNLRHLSCPYSCCSALDPTLMSCDQMDLEQLSRLFLDWYHEAVWLVICVSSYAIYFKKYLVLLSAGWHLQASHSPYLRELQVSLSLLVS